MRRLWAAGAAMLVCLALSGLPAAGQEASPATPTVGGGAASTAVLIHIEEPEWVTYPDEAGTTSDANGVRQLRGFGRDCRYDDADPRFSSWSDIVHNADCYSPGEDRSKCVVWGNERIPGPDGAWVGTYRGGSIGPVRNSFEVLEGTGAYEGWTFVRYLDMAAPRRGGVGHRWPHLRGSAAAGAGAGQRVARRDQGSSGMVRGGS